MKIQIFLQARMGSTRLPGKVLMKINGRTMFSILAERLKRIKDIDRIILVTSQDKKNNELVKEAEETGFGCFRGSEENVLDRFYQASLMFKPDIIIRIGGDCPIIDPELVSRGLDIFKNGNYDMLSNARIRTYPDGMDFEIFDARALKTAWEDNFKKFGNDKEKFDKAEIAPDDYILAEKKFKNKDFINEKNLSNVRLTLDYKEDFEVIKKVCDNFNGNSFGLDQIINFLEKNPELYNLNKQYINYEQGFGTN